MSLTLAAAIFLAATAALPHSSDAPRPGPRVEAAILQIESETVAAYLKGDVEKLDRIWADEYGCFLSNGAVLAKPDYLAGLRSGRIRYDVLEVESLTVQAFGDFAVAWGRARVEGQDGSATVDGVDRFLTVYHLWQGRWQAITTHTSRLPRDPNPSGTRRSPAEAVPSP
jgi:ketosteroid isomerase-like protein